MAFGPSALKGATFAVMCMILVLSLKCKPAEGTSCGIDSCISICPSECNEKAAKTCEGAKEVDEAKCKPNCRMGCSAGCPEGATCDCNSECDSYCKDSAGPQYTACLAVVFQHCKDSCERDCTAEKVNS